MRRVHAISPLHPCSLKLGPIQRKSTTPEFYIIRKADYYLIAQKGHSKQSRWTPFSPVTSTVQREQDRVYSQLLSQAPVSTHFFLLISITAAKTIGYTKTALMLNFLLKSGPQCKVYPSCKQQGAALSQALQAALPAAQPTQSPCQEDFPDRNGSPCRACAASGEGLHLVSFSAYLLLLPCWASKQLDVVWPSATSPSRHTTEASSAIMSITLCPHLFSLNHISVVQLFLPPFHLCLSNLVSPASALEQ